MMPLDNMNCTPDPINNLSNNTTFVFIRETERLIYSTYSMGIQLEVSFEVSWSPV